MGKSADEREPSKKSKKQRENKTEKKNVIMEKEQTKSLLAINVGKSLDERVVSAMDRRKRRKSKRLTS